MLSYRLACTLLLNAFRSVLCCDCGSVEAFHSGSNQLVGIMQVCTVLSKATSVHLVEDPVHI